MATPAHQRTVERFTDHNHLCCNPARMQVETTALGAAYGSTGYTTRAQADRIGDHLALAPGVRLADIGAGSGWPGLYFASTTGCSVVGTDLPIDGLLRAKARAASDRADVDCVLATGKHQPLRSEVFDAVVHTDVLCCLGPKQTVLQECHRLLRPGGRLAFTTIHVADNLAPTAHRRAVRAGPWHVVTRRPYPDLVERAGFTDIRVHDVTPEYQRTQRAWLEATHANADALRRATSAAEFELGQAERRRTRRAIAEGLLCRSLITASRPSLLVTRSSGLVGPMWLGDSVEDAWAFVAEMGLVRGLTDNLDDASREQAMAELRRRISASSTADGVTLGSAAWLITARQP